MDAAYLKAAHPPPFRILSQDLAPFSLGHEIAFQRFGNKFSFEKGETPDESDLFKAVYLCSRKYHRGMSLDGFTIPFRARAWARIFGKAYIRSAFERFREYIAAHTKLPDFYSKDDESKQTVGAPTVQSVKVSLMANLKRTEEEALTMPFSLAFWDHITWLEGQGTVQIIDEAELERQQLMDAEFLKMESLLVSIGEKMQAESKARRAPKEAVAC